ncbi:MAG: hypothetical protein ACE5H0_02695 [Bacteroidota bacterium]
MNRRVGILGLFLVLAIWTNVLVAGDRPFSVELRSSYTTTSKVFFNPDAASAFERNQFFPVDDIFGLGLDFRRDVAYNLKVGISIEYISASSPFTQSVRDRKGQDFELVLDDGYRLIPVELSSYFVIPFSGERVKVYMGGGVGFYVGERKVEAAGITTQTLEKNTRFGIHVMSGVDYFLTPILALRGELKFRDPQVESTSRYPDKPVEYEGRTILFDQRPFRSRINIDGITFNLGVMFRF